MVAFNSRMNCAAACGLSSARSTICTNADPTITPSAMRLTSPACSGVDTPNPIAIGVDVACLIRSTKLTQPLAICVRAPVTPAIDTR